MTIRVKPTLLAVTLTSFLLVAIHREGGIGSTRPSDRAVQLGSAALVSEGSLTVPSRVTQAVELNLPERYWDRARIDYSEVLQVYVDNGKDCCTNKAPIVGSYEADNRSVRFIPKFSFVEGQDYVIRVQHRSANQGVFHKLTPFKIQPKTPVVKPEVTGVYPSGNILPENVLRLYIHFSTPMKPHVAFNYIKLVDASGKVDDAAFMKFKQELWSEDRKRLTVLMDPGRIKRNVSTNLGLGPALQKGESYQLVIDGGWPTANGTKPLASFSKSFVVSEALRELPNSGNWIITAPAIRSKDTLTIKFDRPFDHQLLHKDIKVVSIAGEKIKGKSLIGHHETEWHFKPNEAWMDEQIYIVVDGELEDVAGNNFQDLLDHSVTTETNKIPYIFISVDLL